MNNALALPEELNNYKLSSIIDGDSYSIRYKAINTLTSQEYIVEEFFPQFLVVRSSSGDIEVKNTNYETYFQNGKTIYKQDFTAMNSVRDARISSPLEIFEANQTLYKVSPYITYEPLVNDMQELADEHILIDILKPLCDALKFMHGKNIFHGEIDFKNLAKVNGHACFKPFSSGRFIFLKYVKLDQKYYPNAVFAPEIANAKSLNAEIDIFAMGAMIFFMMSGKKLILEEFESSGITSFIPDDRVYSKKFLNAIKKMCSREASERPDGFYELRQVLKTFVPPVQEEVEEEVFETLSSSPKKKVKKEKKVKVKKIKVKVPKEKKPSGTKRPWMKIALMSIILAVVGFAAYFYSTIPKKFDTKQMNELKLWQYKFAAITEDIHALEALASMYHKGDFVEKNIPIATEYFLQASDLGSTTAQRALAQIYFDNENFTKAQHFFELLAAKGDEEAQIVLEAILEVNKQVNAPKKSSPKKRKPKPQKKQQEDIYAGLSPEDIAAIKQADAHSQLEDELKDEEQVEVTLDPEDTKPLHSTVNTAIQTEESTQDEDPSETSLEDIEPEEEILEEVEPVKAKPVIVLTPIEKADKLAAQGKFDEAIAIYFTESDKGDVHAQERVNDFYLTGWNIPKDVLKKMYQKMATDGDITAQYALAILIKTQAKGKVSEYIKSLDLLFDCVKNDFPPAQEIIDNFYSTAWGLKGEKLLSVHKHLVNQGVKRSQFPLAELYLKQAQGRIAYYQNALKWFRSSAANGHDTAVKKVSQFYVDGWGMKKSTLKKMFEKMRKKGDDKARYALATLYMETVNGKASSYEYAFSLFKQGAKKSHTPSQQKIDDFYENTWEMPKNVAKSLYQKMSKKGDLEANFTLGMWYVENAHGKLNYYLKAKSIFEFGAKKGHELSKERSDDFFVSGWDIPKDDLKRLYLSMYTENGDLTALHALGLFHLNGSAEHDPDYRLAKKYFDLGAKKYHVPCEHSLGDMYAKGLGVEKDPRRAEFWHGRANMHAKQQ